MTVELHRICPVAAIKDQTAVRIPLPGRSAIALCRLRDQVYAIADTCTHEQASLSEGEILDGQIYCPFHGGGFDIVTGAATERPCTVALKTFPVVIKDGDVFVNLA